MVDAISKIESIINKLSQNDLDAILPSIFDYVGQIKNANIFITGGTGFFGCWFLESLLYLNKRLNLNISTTVLTRNKLAFKERMTHLYEPAVNFHEGDIRDFAFPEGIFQFIIHSAGAPTEESKINRFEIFASGTKRVLDMAKQCGCKKFLFISSGSIYGKNPEIKKFDEELNTIPSYEEGYAELGLAKRVGEFLCCEYAKEYGFESKIARCFSFIGPYIPLDLNFAAGNFIRDALNGGPIVIKGDGTAVRSYMYMSDLMVWLWTILFKGKSCYPYNVGSEKEITIRELAYKVSEIYKKLTGKTVEVIVEKMPDPSKPVDRYVPSTKRAREELGLKETVPIDEAIEKTFRFYMSR